MRLVYLLLTFLLLSPFAALPDDSVNTVPSGNASFLTNLQDWMNEELGDRMNEYLKSPIVASGCTNGGTSGTQITITACVAYTHHRVNQAQQVIDLADATHGAGVNDTCWIVVNKNTTGAIGGNFTREAGTHLGADCTSGTQPSLPVDSVWVAEVTIAASTISAVVDLRPIKTLSGLGVAVEGFTSFNAAVDEYNDAGDPNVSLTLSSRMHVASNTTTTSNISMLVLNGGMFDVDSGVTLTLATCPVAGPYQIFAGSGTITLTGCGRVYASWFPGADLGAKINNAVAALASSGAIIDTTDLGSAQAAAAAITLSKPMQLNVGAFTLTTGVANGIAITSDDVSINCEGHQSVIKLGNSLNSSTILAQKSISGTTTTLGAAISDTTGTSITVASSSGFAVGDTFDVDNERMKITAISGTTWTVWRGFADTAATHSNGATVTGHLQELTGVTVQNCTLDGNRANQSSTSPSYSSVQCNNAVCHIENNVVKDNLTDGITAATGGSMLAINNLVKDNGKAGIYCDGSTIGCRVIGNRLERNGDQFANASGSISLNSSYGVRVSVNTILDGEVGISYIANNGPLTAASFLTRDILISGNYIRDMDGSCISIANASTADKTLRGSIGDNTAQLCGQVDNAPSILIQNVSNFDVHDNIVVEGNGIGISFDVSTATNVTNLTAHHNYLDGNLANIAAGGAIRVRAQGADMSRVVLSENIIVNHSGASDGGINLDTSITRTLDDVIAHGNMFNNNTADWVRSISGTLSNVRLWDNNSPPTYAQIAIGERAKLSTRVQLSPSRIGSSGTAWVGGDIALSAGWGDTAAISTLNGNDLRGRLTITCNGAGIVANPTITVTFPDGAFATAPIATVMLSDTTEAAARGTALTWDVTTTTIVITFYGTCNATSTYEFSMAFIE